MDGYHIHGAFTSYCADLPCATRNIASTQTACPTWWSLVATTRATTTLLEKLIQKNPQMLGTSANQSISQSVNQSINHHLFDFVFSANQLFCPPFVSTDSWEPQPWLAGPSWDPQFCAIPYGSIVAYATKLDLPSLPWLRAAFPGSKFLNDNRALKVRRSKQGGAAGGNACLFIYVFVGIYLSCLVSLKVVLC